MFRSIVRIYNDKEKMLWSHFNTWKLSDNELHSLQFIPVDMAFLGVDEDWGSIISSSLLRYTRKSKLRKWISSKRKGRSITKQLLFKWDQHWWNLTAPYKFTVLTIQIDQIEGLIRSCILGFPKNWTHQRINNKFHILFTCMYFSFTSQPQWKMK